MARFLISASVGGSALIKKRHYRVAFILIYIKTVPHFSEGSIYLRTGAYKSKYVIYVVSHLITQISFSYTHSGK